MLFCCIFQHEVLLQLFQCYVFFRRTVEVTKCLLEQFRDSLIHTATIRLLNSPGLNMNPCSVFDSCPSRHNPLPFINTFKSVLLPSAVQKMLNKRVLRERSEERLQELLFASDCRVCITTIR